MNNIIKVRCVLAMVRCYAHNIQLGAVKCAEVLTYTPVNCYSKYLYPKVRLFSTWCENNKNELVKVTPQDTETVPVTDGNFDMNIITNGDPVLEKKLKVLFLEVEILRQEGSKVPSSINVDQWKELVGMATRSMRRRYLTFLWKNEIKRVNDKQRKEEKKRIREELNAVKNKVDANNEHIQYGLHRNTIFMRVYDSTINHFYNCKLIEAMQFSQKLVVDCGYDSHMTSREAINCAKQIMLLFSENRVHSDPFNLYLCNIKQEGLTMRELQKFIKTLYEDQFPLNITEKSYLDLFPKEDIVYLTPHCREELREFDHDAIYVIGAIVDKVNKDPLTLAKAKKEGLRMAKLPLDRYLSWGSGSGKSLTLNQMIQILLDLRCTGDWKKALRHVPRRKISQDEDKQERSFYKKPYGNDFKYKKRTFTYAKGFK